MCLYILVYIGNVVTHRYCIGFVFKQIRLKNLRRKRVYQQGEKKIHHIHVTVALMLLVVTFISLVCACDQDEDGFVDRNLMRLCNGHPLYNFCGNKIYRLPLSYTVFHIHMTIKKKLLEKNSAEKKLFRTVQTTRPAKMQTRGNKINLNTKRYIIPHT